MATLDQLENALRGADAAGDTAAAQALAGEIVKMRSAAPQQQPNTMVDVAKSLGAGVGKGAAGMAGMVGDLNSLVGAGSDWLASKFMSPEKLAQTRQINAQYDKNSITPPTSSAVRRGMESLTGEFHKPETTAGKYAQSVGEMVPATMVGPGGVIRKAGQALGAGVGSEAAGELTEGSKAEPYARVAGALVGGMAPDAIRRSITPNPVSPERQALVDALNNEGVTSLTAGQRTGNKTLQYAESILGDAPGAGQGANRIQQEGQRQFTEAAMRRAGTGPSATPEILAENQNRLGQNFRNLSARNNVQFDPQFAQDVSRAVTLYDRVPPSQQRAVVDGYFNDIMAHAQRGPIMPGPQYQEMRSRLSRQSQTMRNSDPTLSQALHDLRDSLDNAMSRSISPADRELWNTTRQEYGAQKILEKAASRAGEAAAEGQIVPSNLRNAVTARNHGAYARGQGDFAELARAGSGVMAPLPNSGTGQRVAIHTLATLLGGGAGMTAGPVGASLGAIGAAAAGPAAIGRALMSRPSQAYLGNQLIGAPTDQVRRSTRLTQLVQALLAARDQVPALAQ